MNEQPINLDRIECLQILNERGEADTKQAPTLDDDELLRIHRAMVLARKLDLRMLAMQRQGEMGTFAPGLGQEATQIGQIYPLRNTDWFVPSYRSLGAQLWRGWTLEGLLLLWDGFFEGFDIPEGVNDLPFSIVVGAHVPVAAGVAMGIKQRGDDAVVLTNFGDGAISEGAVNEAFNFAAVYQSPVVFVVENNGWAISIPAHKQSATGELARRGPGFGVPAIRVDGNDVLAMIVATTQAVARARSGGGPTLIEAVTYRMSLHTTADDPTVYRSDEEVERWKPRDPLLRFEKYLTGKGLLDADGIDRIGAECEQEVLDARERFRRRRRPNAREVFDYMFEKLPPWLEAQKREYLDKLDRREVE
ncbi:MAG: pyruvate dehydrogenase (acetyl-transferring) E1 component subunit alpha [Planctomycetota bacterium]